jgi:hypothetical protein
MRRYTDREGGSWDVVVGRESFGALYAIFVPAGDNPGPARQTLLQAESQLDAETEVADRTPEELHVLFERSEPKDMT